MCERKGVSGMNDGRRAVAIPEAAPAEALVKRASGTTASFSLTVGLDPGKSSIHAATWNGRTDPARMASPRVLQCGLILLHWTKDSRIAYNTINARDETVIVSAEFQESSVA